MKQNDWTSQMRRRLADREVSVPDDLWDKIEARLDAGGGNAPVVAGRGGVASGARRRRVVRMALWAVSSAAVVALLVVAGYHADEITIRRLGTGAVVADASRPAAVAPVGSPVAGEPPLAASASACAGPQEPAALAVAEDSVPCAGDIGAGLQANAAGTPAAVTAGHEEKSAAMEDAGKMPLPLVAYAPERRGGGNPVARFTIGAHTGGSLTDSRISGFPAQRVLSSPSFLAGNALPGQDGVGGCMASCNVALLSRYKEVKHHAQPLSVGVSVGYALTGRLSVVSGVVYTRAVTDFIKSTGDDGIVETQKLHYVGVPLALKYRVWGTRLIHTYATAGGEADFNVAARTTAGGVSVDRDRDRAQFSVNAAAGVQVNVVPQVGVYVEPGVKYYFDNKSQVETIFKDKPWAFSLSVGLRVEL